MTAADLSRATNTDLHTKRRRIGLGCALGCLLLANACPATSTAQTASTSGEAVSAPSESAANLQEVTVTATRRRESIDKVPISITAFTQLTMDEKGIKNVDQLARFTPGLTFGPAGDGLTSSIAIRGIASGVGASTTGIYIDDTPIQARSGTGIVTENAYPQIFDLARVEVLKGPQGTLFGTGSMGGTIRFITPEPGLHEYSGYDRVEASETKNGQPSYELGAAAGGPIVDGALGFRVSAFYQSLGGYVNREPFTGTTVTDKGYNFGDTTALRASLKWVPSDALTVIPSVFYQRQRRNDDYYWLSLSDPSESEFNSGFTLPEPVLDTFALPAVRVNWKLPGVELISVTSFFHRTETRDSDYSNYIFDVFTGIPTPSAPDAGYRVLSADVVRQNSFTQEIRLQSTDATSRLQWVAGTLFQSSRLYTNQYLPDPGFPQLMEAIYGASVQDIFGEGLANGLYSFAIDQWANDKQYALFGQVDYSLASHLKATLGARVARTTLDYHRIFNGPLACVACTGAWETTGGTTAPKSPVTPRVELSYLPNSHDLYYVSASKGFRVGGINNPAIATDTPGCPGGLQTPKTYAPDTLWDYEVGAKNLFLDSRLRTQVSIFYIVWKDVQQSVNSNTCYTASYKTNLGDAAVRGFDFSAELRVTDNLLTTLSGGYQRARYTTTALGPPDNVGAREVIEEEGDSLGVSPWNATLSGEYDFTAFARRGYIRVDYSYTAKDGGETPVRDPRTSAYDPGLLADPALKFLEARLGFRVGGADISVFGRNLLNDTPPLGLYHDGLGDPLYSALSPRPRTIGLTATYAF